MIALLLFGVNIWSQDTRTFKVFQFPANKIPTIDGNPDDWKMVSQSYVVVMAQLHRDKTQYINTKKQGNILLF